MTERCLPGRAHIITHIHTDASNAEASELDGRIGKVLRQIDGEDTLISWSECFTSIERLTELVQRGRGGRGPVHMVMVTDHMRSGSHRLPERNLSAAMSDHRIGLGAELATRTRDADGQYRHGPEILAYGAPERVEVPGGSYFGLSQDLLDELYDTCMDDDGLELCTRQARDLLLRRGVAHAISHPFDGHKLSFVGMFNIISEFAFVEAINGGYFENSAKVLKAYIAFNNAVIGGATLAPERMNPTTSQIVDHIHRHGRPIHLWSGSDAHSHDFDRVVVAMDCGEDAPEHVRPGRLFSAMLNMARTNETAAAGPGWQPPQFINLGHAGTPLSQVSDITAVVMRNIHSNVKRSLKFLKPKRFLSTVLSTYTVTADELRIRRTDQTGRKQLLMTDFNPVTLLPELRPPLTVARPLRSVA